MQIRYDVILQLTVLMQVQKIAAVVMGENHKTVITFDLQLYEKAVKLHMHKAPDLDHLVFRIGEMHTIMASLRALGASIDGSGFDEGWIEARAVWFNHNATNS